MNSEELSKEVQEFIEAAQERVLGVGHDEYMEPGSGSGEEEKQRFETMPLDTLYEYAEEELRDLANYATMLHIRLRRLRAQPQNRSLNVWQAIIGQWAEETFGHSYRKYTDVKSCVEHLREELAEFEASWSSQELADMLVLICTLAHILGTNLDDALDRKHKINLKRKWVEPDERGVVHHL